jgi:hypothetical protein
MTLEVNLDVRVLWDHVCVAERTTARHFGVATLVPRNPSARVEPNVDCPAHSSLPLDVELDHRLGNPGLRFNVARANGELASPLLDDASLPGFWVEPLHPAACHAITFAEAVWVDQRPKSRRRRA